MGASRVRSVLFARLHQGNGRGDDDVFDRAAARQVADRRSKALQNRAERVGSGQALYQFVADVSRAQIGEDERIDFAGNGASRRFFFGNRGDEGRVGLDFSVEAQ